jgi:cytoskeletal protein RodZ
MRNIHEREREKIMMGGFQSGRSYESEVNKREEELSEKRNEHSGVSDQEISRLKNTTAQRVFWIVVGIVLLLLLIVMIVGTNVFHWR